MYLSVCPLTDPPTHLKMYLSLCMFICVNIYLDIYLHRCLYTCINAYLHTHAFDVISRSVLTSYDYILLIGNLHVEGRLSAVSLDPDALFNHKIENLTFVTREALRNAESIVP